MGRIVQILYCSFAFACLSNNFANCQTRSEQILELLQKMQYDLSIIVEKGSLGGTFDKLAFQIVDITGGWGSKYEPGTLPFWLRSGSMGMAGIADKLHQFASEFLEQLKANHRLITLCLNPNTMEDCFGLKMDELAGEVIHLANEATVKWNALEREWKQFMEAKYFRYRDEMFRQFKVWREELKEKAKKWEGKVEKHKNEGNGQDEKEEMKLLESKANYYEELGKEVERIAGKLVEEENWLTEMKQKVRGTQQAFQKIKKELDELAKKPLEG